MEVLKELASEECLRRSGLGVVRIAERLGREKSQVSRALRALEAEGLVERDPRTRTYQLGWGLYALAARGIETRLVRAATAHLHRLAADQRAEVQLCVLIGGQVLTLISVPPRADIRAEAPIETPAGPVLALDWSDGALRDLVPPGSSDDDSRLDHESLLASSAHARTHGYVHYPATEEEPARYAAPVRDFRGIVLAALQLTERAGEQPPLTGISAEQAVVHTARALSADLGFER
ncbi:MAG: helix-turn-helix domain-containing protein [Phycicoccus sp.]|nr:helix-turn-helix domain-containing protein [Phycicoccus sp.]NMM32542.1 helix-turn-helix domain-containing protein [Phycicoccus sp.]